MQDFVIVPAYPGFYAKYPEDRDWNEVIAWRINRDGGNAIPVTIWVAYGDHDDRYQIRTPSGEVEDFNE